MIVYWGSGLGGFSGGREDCPHGGLLLSGVTPLSGAIRQLGGGVMPPYWCSAACRDAVGGVLMRRWG